VLEILNIIQVPLMPLTMSLPRIMMVFWVLPFMSDGIFMNIIRSAFVFSLALMALPVVSEEFTPEKISLVMIVFIIIKEAAIGLILGYLASVPFWVAAGVGSIVDTQRGASVASLFTPFFRGQVSPMGILLIQFFTTMFFISGGFLIMMGTIYQSYVLWPITQFFPNMDMSSVEFFSGQLHLILYLIVLLAAPMTILMFVIDFSMGLINRFVPQLQVFFLALPIKGTTAIFVMTLYIPALSRYLNDKFFEFSLSLDMLNRLFGN